MPNVNAQVVKPLDVGFTTSNEFVSRCIRVVSSNWDWKQWGNEADPSHALFANPIATSYFAAEMVGSGLELDDSIEKEYLTQKNQKFFGFKRYPIFDNTDARIKGVNELGRLKTIGVDYGYDQILKEIGLHERFSLWFVHIQTNPHDMICSGLVNYLAKFLGGKGWGDNPTPLDIWNDPAGVLISNAVVA